VSDWQRVTHESSYADLPPDVQLSIASYAEKHELGDVGADATFCAVTTSERKKLFGTQRQRTSILVTPALLVWALSEDDDVTTLAVRRSEVEIGEFDSTLVHDTGLEVFGFVPLGASERGTVFIGLGPEPASLRLKETLDVEARMPDRTA
jgi:hypothetical protein